MTKRQGWHGEREAHGLCARGISVRPRKMWAGGVRLDNQKKRYRRGSFFEVTSDYCFRETHVGRKDNEFHCMRKGDIGRVTSNYVSLGTLGIAFTFIRKDGKVFFDDTSTVYVAGKLRRMSRKDKKDRVKIDSIYYKED